MDPAVASKLPFERPSDIYTYLKLLSPVSRTHFLFHALHLALERAWERKPNVLLLNAYWYKYFATEVAHGGDPSLAAPAGGGVSRAGPHVLPFGQPGGRVGAQVPAQRLRERLPARRADIFAFQRRAHEALDALAVEFSWSELDGRSSPSEITTTMIQQLEEGGYGHARVGPGG